MKESNAYALGFILKLAESNAKFDDVERFFWQKRAQAWSDQRNMAAEPTLSRRTYERIYSGTRKKLMRENARAQKGSKSFIFQGLRNPVTGKFRIPVSFGSTKSNLINSTMTPAQANMVALLTKYKNLKGFNDVARKSRRGNSNFEFLNDPTIFNSHTNKFTSRGKSDFKKAYRHVHGFDPDDYMVNSFTSRMFGDTAGFGGSPFTFGSVHPRRI